MADESHHIRDEKKRGIPWKWLLMLATTVVVIYLLVSRLAGGEELLEVVDRASWHVALFAVALQVYTLAVTTIQWSMVLRAMGYAVPFGRAFEVLLATRPLDLMAPSRANDLLRPLGIRDIVPVWQGSSSILAQRAIDVQSLCLLAIFGALATGQSHWAGLAGVVLAAAWVVLAMLYWQRERFLSLPIVGRFEETLGSLSVGFVALARKPTAFLAVSAVALAGWAGNIGIVWVLSKAFGADLVLLDIAALWPLAIFVGMLPLTVAGMGTRDAAFVSLLAVATTAAIEEAAVLAVTFSYALVVTCLPALVGIPFMLRYMHELPEPVDDE